MFDLARRSSSRVLAAALLALTTMLVGLAHRPVAPTAALEHDAAWLLPDGSPVFVCHVDLDATRGRSDGGAPPTERCDACRLMAAPGLGGVAEIVVVAPAEVAIGRVVVADAAVAVSPPIAPRSRGPPAWAATFGAA